MYVIGIEGGGTRSQLIVAGPEGDVLGQYEGGALNLYSAGIETALSNLTDLIQAALQPLGAGPEAVGAVCIGSAGLGREQEKQLVGTYLRDLGVSGRILLVSDAEITLHAALEGQQGVLLVAGNGSVAFSLNSQGRVRRCGGWGHILGDEGSAYDMGRRALQAALQAYDGRAGETKLLPLILEQSGLDSVNRLIPYVYQNFDKERVAAFGPLVEKAAYAEDPAAIRILQEATLAHYQLIKTLLDDLDTDSPLRVVAHGSVMQGSQVIYKSLIMKLSADFPEIEFSLLEKSPAEGAVALALGLLARN